MSGRFARNLALSLSGGALATFLGAHAAHAEEVGAAQAQSTGTGTVGTGDATAVGNQSATNTSQTITVSGNLGVIQVINQQANVTNYGTAVANTGGNIAIGNESNNTADGTQEATGGGNVGGAANQGSALNESDGTANITTGAASVVGNRSTTNVLQEAKGNAHGQLGGILVINQEANVINAGTALANTGDNDAYGNDSTNDAGLLQAASATPGSLATNNGTAASNSNGKATINTGAGAAIGNESTTNVVQKASGDAGGELGGLMIVNQDVDVYNVGGALANTGGNEAWGNQSHNTADVGTEANPQTAAVVGLDDIGIASNNGEASNTSGGSAAITTGAATAIGNKSTTNVTQTATGQIIGDGGLSYVNQDSTVLNGGIGVANSGLNYGWGNQSHGDAETHQDASLDGFTEVGVVGQFGLAANDSDGTAAIQSGVANAAGNIATTNVGQTAEITGGALELQFQSNDVANVGFGVANSGINFGTGNDSDNHALVGQSATADPGPVLGVDGIDVAVVGQFGKAANASDGTATITTGAATAFGNQSATDITQHADPNVSAIQNQTATVINYGEGYANTGGNRAVGNASDNFGDNGAGGEALVEAAGLIDDVLGNPAVPNYEDLIGLDDLGGDFGLGEFDDAILDATQTAQAALAGLYDYLDPSGYLDPTLVPPGPGALSGLNDLANYVGGLRNDLGIAGEDEVPVEAQATDFSTVGQTATLAPTSLDAENVILANDGEASNASDGTATIASGAANGAGNVSTTKIGQTSEAAGTGSGILVSLQNADVLNAGVGGADTGYNNAVGNDSFNSAGLTQSSALEAGDVTSTAALTMSNNGQATNTSDGTATIATGAAVGTGNRSGTDIAQTATGGLDGSGLGLARQDADVDNVGVGVAQTGGDIEVPQSAVGNASESYATIASPNADVQDLIGPDADIAAGTLTTANLGTAANTSDGTATIATGAAEATGNIATNDIDQTATADIDGSGLVLSPQSATVNNRGGALATTGGNGATGNDSSSSTFLRTDASVLGDQVGGGELVVRDLSVINTSTASGATDGAATIATGAAKAEGTVSQTDITQTLAGSVALEGTGFDLQRQDATVDNWGAGYANTGDNDAVGNASFAGSSLAGGVGVDALDDGDAIDPDAANTVGTLTVASTAVADNATDGTATIATGAALGRGNVAATAIDQTADASIGADGFGAVPSFQAAAVHNEGYGVGNSGFNYAAGNRSQTGSGTFTVNTVSWDGVATLDTASVISTAAAHNASDGTATIATGVAEGVGNSSGTTIDQTTTGDAGEFGFALQRQTATVGNLGTGLGNSGVNGAIGNWSAANAGVQQFAATEIGEAPGDGALTVGTFTQVQAATASNDTDGSATIATGPATGRGNVSTTGVTQTATADAGDPAFGVVLDLQEAVVVNDGLGIGNSGVNGAIGNFSGFSEEFGNVAAVSQISAVGVPDLTADLVTVTNAGTASNESNGTATIGTGAALGTGNQSGTHVDQVLDGDAGDFGFALGRQGALVTNFGHGIANSGVNGAVGNASIDEAAVYGIDEAPGQTAVFAADLGITATQPITVGNTGHAANESNGVARIGTGAATGAGNVSTTDVDQDLDLDVEDGFAIVGMDQEVTNTGFGTANSGINAAVGNLSHNTAGLVQTAALGPLADDDPLDGQVTLDDAQTVINGGGAENNSTGVGEVASGKATGTGNTSTTGTTQAATAEAGAFAQIGAVTDNFGEALANSGRNLGLGNASTNDASLLQSATGAGVVTNNGVAGNGATDPKGGPTTTPPTTPPPGGPGVIPGTDPGTTTPPGTNPGTTGRPSLPVMGTEAQAEAVIGALLILFGFGLRRASKRLS